MAKAGTHIDYSDWWNDIVAIGRANASILVAIAAAFVFLPVLASSFLTVPIEALPAGATLDQYLARFSAYYRNNWLPQLLLLLVSTLGQLLLYTVLLDARRPSVGDAFRLAAPLYVPLFFADILTNIIIGAGFALLIVPGLYLFGRVMLTGAALVAERLGNPVGALSRSWALTRGNGWRIVLFAILVFGTALVIQFAVSGTLGSAIGLMPGAGDASSLRSLLLAALDALFAAIYFVLGTVLWVALYRRLAGGTKAI